MKSINNIRVLACNPADEKESIVQDGETHHTALTKSSQTLVSLTPNPSWSNSSYMNEAFFNIGSSSTNGANYKGKEVVIDDGENNYKKGFFSYYPKGGIKIQDGSNKNVAFEDESFVNIGNGYTNGASYKMKQVAIDDENDNMGSVFFTGADNENILIPSEVMALFHDFVKKCSEAFLKKQDQQELTVQEFAEALYGKEFFSSEKPNIIGPFTAMMAQCHHSLKSVPETTHMPPLSVPQTNINTANTLSSNMFLPSPSTPNATATDSIPSPEPRDLKRRRSSRKTSGYNPRFKDFDV